MRQIIQVPVKIYPDGELGLDLEEALGRRVIIRAHEIQLKSNVLDYDGHHVPEAHAKRSIKCKSKMFNVRDKVVSL